jgi:hypothetical protein
MWRKRGNHFGGNSAPGPASEIECGTKWEKVFPVKGPKEDVPLLVARHTGLRKWLKWLRRDGSEKGNQNTKS